MADEHYANAGDNSLTLQTALTAIVTSGAQVTFNTSGTSSITPNFRIRIGSERFLVTSTGGGTNWTATRQIEGSPAQAHNIGDTIVYEITRLALLGLINGANGNGSIAGTGAANISGATGFGSPSDHAHQGGWQLIQAITGTGNPTAIIFTNIPQTYRHLVVVFKAVGTTGAAGAVVQNLILNGDQTNNYDYAEIGSSATTTTRNQANAAGPPYVGSVGGAGNSAGFYNMGFIWLPYYQNTTYNKSGWWRCVLHDSASTGGHPLQAGEWQWHSQAAITQIAFTNNGPYALYVGSEYDLYGVN